MPVRRARPGAVALARKTQQAGGDAGDELEPDQALTAVCLFEAFFVVGANTTTGAPEPTDRWPVSMAGSRLERGLIWDGFCPSPAAFFEPDPHGFGGEPFVFSILETALDPRADPYGMLYGCVASAGEDFADATATTVDGTQEGGGVDPRRLFCLVSKLPLFGLLFGLLQALSDGRLEQADLAALYCLAVEELLEAAPHGLEQVPGLRLRLPDPLPVTWYGPSEVPGASGLSGSSQAAAQWQAKWALELLLERGGELTGDFLLRLLAHVLLEQSIMLLGDAPRLSAVTLALRGILWPFRWLHLFLSAPPPSRCLDMPLHDAPFPMVTALSQVPPQWAEAGAGRRKIRSVKDFPPEMITAELRHGHFEIAAEHKTAGGLRSRDARLPGGRHAACRRELHDVRQRLKEGKLSCPEAAERARRVLEAEVVALAALVRGYAEEMAKVTEGEHVAPEPPPPTASPRSSPRGSPRGSPRSADASVRERCWRRASNGGEFARWLARHRGSAGPGEETDVDAAFYKSFFQTQLCLDMLEREIVRATADS